ncbi:MAG: imidazoleglycerol-phosphate dehydratase HisB [Chloroflexi bacterium]|nr:imidazoleglycerol-phosphate dehydratase HisB [Anaerolineaceae bacterium]NMB89730.1 imidazoleglycerol-phosphate dehydratase HisB [Chloroflexota bacterium]
MKTALVLFDSFDRRDFNVFYSALVRLKELQPAEDVTWDLCGASARVVDRQGQPAVLTRIRPDLGGYDCVVVLAGAEMDSAGDAPAAAWLQSARKAPILAGLGDSLGQLAAAGLLQGKQVASIPALASLLQQAGAVDQDSALVEDGNLFTAATGAAVDLARALLARQAGEDLARRAVLAAAGRGEGTQPLPAPARTGRVSRKTAETQVSVRLHLDGSGRHQIDTGLPFLDHMLAQVAVHGLFDLDIQAKGDVHIDPHHTMEDVGLSLGQAFQEALGDRRGLVRAAFMEYPMDESLARVAVDFSGRPYAVISVDWHTPAVGGLPVSLFAHFLESFAIQARCNLHAQVFYGRDDHHQAEAIFKALGRALDAATRIDPRRTGVPSSKGILI